MKSRSLALLPLLLLACVPCLGAEDLSGIVWETNTEDPPIGDPAALKGGTIRLYMTAYPLTLRVVGPNANDAFASWKRAYTMGLTMVTRHPTTDRHIPVMATHWSVQADGRTIYYKLDPDARWSDGEPITAADYVHTWHMIRSEHIVDPFFNQYANDCGKCCAAVKAE